MANRIYIMPTTGGGSPANPRRPAYLDGISRGALYYGASNICLTLAEVTTTQHSLIIQNPDILAAPEDIDTNLKAGAVIAVQNFLDSIGVPSQWVNMSLTYRKVIRKVGHFFYFAGRYSKISGRVKLVPDGFDLSTPWGALSEKVRSDIRTTSDSLGINYSSIKATDTAGNILKFLADYWESPLTIHGVNI